MTDLITRISQLSKQQQQTLYDKVQSLRPKKQPEAIKQTLTAYVILDHKEIEIKRLREFVADFLPDYMIPSAFVALDKFPLTPNGKIDRKALPAPSIDGTIGTKPVTPTEELLASLWASLLKCETIRREDNFFELGGHSLTSTQLIARIRDAFHVELPVRAVFEHPRLSQLADAIETANREVNVPPIAKQSATSNPVLSYAQQRLWFLNQLEESHSATYNMPAALRLAGHIDVAALQASLHWLLQRHESLRTVFPTQNGQASVRILDLEQLEILNVHDLSQLSNDTQTVEVQHRANQHAIAPYDVAQGPLLKAELLLLHQQQSVLLLNMHHIISDGWSMSVFIRDWQHAYTAFAQGEQPTLPPPLIQYGDYAAWQRDWLTGKVLQQQVDYWCKQLAGIPELLELPTDTPRPPQQSFSGAHYVQRLSPQLSRATLNVSREQDVSLFMTLLTTFSILLSRYTRQNDISVGSPIANRTHSQTEALIGFFVNTLVLRSQIQPSVSFIELLKETRHTCLEAYAHQDIPFEMLVEQLQPARSLSHSPLFQVMLVLQNTDPLELTLPGLEVSALEADYPIAKFDVTLNVEEREGQLHCLWEYATDLFYPDTIERMANHFKVLLTALVEHPAQSISQLSMLTEAERKQLLAWNDTTTDYPRDTTIVAVFEQQVSVTPDNIAVVFEEQQLSYWELNEKANQLANYLLRLKTGTDNCSLITDNCLIAIAVERSLEMVIGLLGILKAGGAYVPIDPSYPKARIQYMLEDSAAPLLVTQSHFKDELSLDEVESVVVCLDETDFGEQPLENPLVNSQASDLAYVIYTSGSTGKPKGVMIDHNALSNYVFHMHQHFVHEGRFAWLSTIAADLGNTIIFGALCSGGTLCVIDQQCALDARCLHTAIKQYEIDYLKITPTHLMGLQTQDKPVMPTRLLIVGGEASSVEWINTLHRQYPHCRILNHYGPTEATVGVTTYLTGERVDNQNTMLPIGKPISNTCIYILDKTGQFQPPGIPGELCIAGSGLARGYLNRPELTAEKFIEVELFGKIERIYKTGDLARWLPDGNLEYLGRIDSQVKLRGFRIELGEIEAVLSQHEAVKEAIVILYEADDNKRLVAYITVISEESRDFSLITELRDWLKARLPDYMIPSHFTVLEQLPLTPNGKIDRKALPAPEMNLTEAYEAPRNDIEQQLGIIWSRLLKADAISIHDNFFELGGDSILSIQIVSQARQAGLQLTPRDLFEHQTIAELATAVRFGVEVKAEQGPVTGEAPLTPIQQGFFERKLPEYWHYNQSILLCVAPDLNIEALRQAFAQVLSHHDALRLRYREVDGHWQQSFSTPTDTVPLAVEDLSSSVEPVADVYTLTQQYQTGLNLTEGPLTYLVVLTWPQEARLFWCIHHLATDGVSWRILLEDLQTAYQHIAAGQRLQLPAKTSSFKAWAERLKSYAASEVLVSELAYWQALPSFSLPVDNPAGENRLEHRQDYAMTLNRKETEALLREAPRAYHTRINDLLLTALALALAEWTGESRCLIDLEGHGRAALFDDIDVSRTVGWFTTIHPIALTLPPGANEDVGAALKAIQEQLRATPHEGIGYGLLAQAGFNSLPKGEVRFNYLGQFDQGIEDDLFGFADETTSSDMSLKGCSDYLIDINGAIIQGQLSLNWSYSGECYLAETIETLAAAYQKYLMGLIQHCRESSENQPNLDTLLPLHINKDAQATLFCLPGLGSKAGYLLPFAKALDTTLAVYGLESPGLDDQSQIPETVEALAQSHIDKIRAIQPDGPYYVIGHSFGAAVALEMAWCLEQAGETLALLAIFDQPTPKYSPEDERQKQHTEFEYLWNIVLLMKDFTDIEPPFSLDELEKTNSLNYACRTVMNWLKQENAHEIFFSSKGLPEELRGVVKVYRANALAFPIYQPQDKQLRCPIDLFCAAESINAGDNELPEGWGWKEHTLTGVNIHQVTGSHISMVKPPHVQGLADKLTHLLKRSGSHIV